MTSPVLTQALEARPQVENALCERVAAVLRQASDALHECRRTIGNINGSGDWAYIQADTAGDTVEAMLTHIASLRAADAGVPTAEPRALIPQSARDWLTSTEPHGAASQDWMDGWDACRNRISSLALSATPAAPAPQPAQREGWFLPLDAINSIQDESIGRLVKRARGAHHADVDLRINGQNERHQADWIKHMERAAPEPQAAMEGQQAVAWTYCWLAELFKPHGGNSMGYYHTGFTDLGGQSRTTKNPQEARRYTKEQAEGIASKLHHLAGVWKAVEHGFASPAVAPSAQPAEDDARDADRYRVLRVRGAAFAGDPKQYLEQALVYRIGNLDAAVDALRGAAARAQPRHFDDDWAPNPNDDQGAAPSAQEPQAAGVSERLTDAQIDEILGAAYRKLVIDTGYTGGMGSETWDRAAARAIEAAVLSTTSAPAPVERVTDEQIEDVIAAHIDKEGRVPMVKTFRALLATITAPAPERITDEQLAGAVARGWCAPENARKVMDDALAHAIFLEVRSLLSTAPAPAAPGVPADAGQAKER